MMNADSAANKMPHQMFMEDRKKLRQECVAASKHFKQTGLHLTHEEVNVWLKKLEAGENIDPPACHV